MGEGFHQAQDPSSGDEVGLNVQRLQHLVHLQHFSKSLDGKGKAGPRERPQARVEQTHNHTKQLSRTVSRTTFLSTSLSLLSCILRGSPTPLLENAHQQARVSGPASPPLCCLGSLGLLHIRRAFSFDHLEGSASPVKSSSSFKALLNASRSKSFADISGHPGPVLWNLTELTHNSFMEPTFLKSLVVVVLVMCACVFIHTQACAYIHIPVFTCSLRCRYMYVCACGSQKSTPTSSS